MFKKTWLQMKKRLHRSVGCFGFRSIHLFSNTAITSKKLQSKNPPIQNSDPDPKTYNKGQNLPASSDYDLMLSSVVKENDASSCSTSQVTNTSVHNSNLSHTKTSNVEENGKYLVFGGKVSEPRAPRISNVRKQQPMKFQSRTLSPSDNQDVHESLQRNFILNCSSVSTLKRNSSETRKTDDFDLQFEKQLNNGSRHYDLNNDVSEDIHNYLLNSPSCTNLLNTVTAKYSDKKLISKTVSLGIPTQRPNHPLKLSPSFMESTSMKTVNDSLRHELKHPSSFLFANEQREMVEELQATRIILLKLKSLLVETPISGNNLYSSTFKPTNLCNDSLHSLNFTTCHCNVNQSRFLLVPSVAEDNRLIPSNCNKSINRTGLEELIDSLAQLHFEKSEILCAT
ncbi:unnamed protein product [Schistosoma guineensis]|nr:unnamed protein product [Schistosoma guineensis]